MFTAPSHCNDTESIIQQTAMHEGGKVGETSHRVYYVDHEGTPISCWHDIPYKVKSLELYNFVAEIPRG